MDSITSSSASQPAMILPLLVKETLVDMQNAKANKDYWKYWIYFRYACLQMKPHIKTKTRQQMQSDYNKLQELIIELKNKHEHKDSEEKQILEMKFIYADNREEIIYESLPNIGVGQDQEEGLIEFDKMDIDELSKLIRSRKNTEKVFGSVETMITGANDGNKPSQ